MKNKLSGLAIPTLVILLFFLTGKVLGTALIEKSYVPLVVYQLPPTPTLTPTSTPSPTPTPFPEIETERNALIALYQSTNGNNWTNKTGWLGNEDHCNWFGVDCIVGTSSVGYVRTLNLGNNQLSGPIPKELGNLSNLGDLSLRHNQLSGPIPKELGNLSNLGILELVSNQLTCWETSEVLAWAQSLWVSTWSDPPGTTICR